MSALTNRFFKASLLSASRRCFASIKVGDVIPKATLHETNPGDAKVTTDLWNQGIHIVFGIPGAFTPVCSKSHLPSYLAQADKIKAKGVQSINCVAVNDAFVMQAFGESQQAGSKVRMLADPQAEFVSAMDLGVDLGVLGGTRSQRFAMVVKDGKVTHLEVEAAPGEDKCTLAGNIMDKI